MKKQLIGYLLFLICTLMASVAMAEYDVSLSTTHWPLRPGGSRVISLKVQKDEWPVGLVKVTFSVSPDDGTASLSPTTATTNWDGKAWTTITVGSDSSVSYYRVTATLDNGQSASTGIFVGDSIVLSTRSSPTLGSSYRPGDSVEFTARVSESGPQGTKGLAVTFSLDRDDGTASLSTTSATTDGNGEASTTLTLGSKASKRYNVTATLDDGQSDTKSIWVHVEYEYILSMIWSSLPLTPGGSTTFTAETQKDGSYVSGLTVTFSVSPDDGTASLSPTTATTDSNGRASTSLSVGSDASGSYTVRATLDSGQFISATKTVDTSVNVVDEELEDEEDLNGVEEGLQDSGTPTDETASQQQQRQDQQQGDGGTPEESTGDGTAPETKPPTTSETLTDETATPQQQQRQDQQPEDGGTPEESTGDGTAPETKPPTTSETLTDETATPQQQQHQDQQQGDGGTPEESTGDGTAPETKPPTTSETLTDETATPQQQQRQDQQQGDGGTPEESTGDGTAPETKPPTTSGTFFTPGQISFSELMFTSRGGLHSLPQWIELYNNSDTETVNLRTWQLTVEARDTDGTHRHAVTSFQEDLIIAPNETALIVTWKGRHSEDIQESRVYRMFSPDYKLRNMMLGQAGFYLKLTAPDGKVSDTAGNIDGDSETEDEPLWKIPSRKTEDRARTSLFRRYAKNTDNPLDGRDANNWRRAANFGRVSDLPALKTGSYWGSSTDIGNPGSKGDGALPVALSSFRAVLKEKGTVLTWTTESELENAGFNILRSESLQGPFVKVNARLIQGAGTTSERHEYIQQDRSAKSDVAYYYRIEDVSFSGVRQGLATVRMRGHISASNKYTTTWGSLKARDLDQ